MVNLRQHSRVSRTSKTRHVLALPASSSYLIGPSCMPYIALTLALRVYERPKYLGVETLSLDSWQSTVRHFITVQSIQSIIECLAGKATRDLMCCIPAIPHACSNFWYQMLTLLYDVLEFVAGPWKDVPTCSWRATTTVIPAQVDIYHIGIHM